MEEPLGLGTTKKVQADDKGGKVKEKGESKGRGNGVYVYRRLLPVRRGGEQIFPSLRWGKGVGLRRYKWKATGLRKQGRISHGGID